MEPIVKLVCGLVLLAAASAPSPAQSPAGRAPEVKAAVDGALGLFQQKPVVVLCDQHGLAQEEDFYSALVRDPRFAENVGNVIVEFGGEASQGIIDRYVAGEDVPLKELRRVWTQTAGWVPGPTSLGYINFFANVRAANRGLAPEHRIKVWLGEPKVDWSKIETFQDILPFLLQRDDNYFRIIRDEILLKHKKTLLIIGIGHIFGQGKLRAKLVQAYPNTLATVVPFTGYIEPDCNAKFVARAKDWPIPAILAPVAGTWLKSQLQLPGCNFVPLETIARIKATPAEKLPPHGASVEERIHRVVSMESGEEADAILYLGPPDTLTESPNDPAIYLDAEYFKEMDRRLRCCMAPGSQRPLDWDGVLQPVAPMKYTRF